MARSVPELAGADARKFKPSGQASAADRQAEMATLAEKPLVILCVETIGELQRRSYFNQQIAWRRRRRAPKKSGLLTHKRHGRRYGDNGS